MPVYQYACTDCSAELEVRQSFTDASLTACPTCEGRLRKILSAVGVVFKGTGFYRNDSRAAATDSHSDTSSSDAKGEAKGDAKETSSPSKPSGSDGSSTGDTTKSSDSDAKKSPSRSSDTRRNPSSSDKSRVAG